MFQFQKVKAKEQPVHSGGQKKISDETDSSEYDSDGDPQSDKGDCFTSLTKICL